MKEQPRIGDVVQVRSDLRSIFAGTKGIVKNLRTRKDGLWTAAELEIEGQRRWFNKGDLADIVRHRAEIGAPKGDFVRIERKPSKRKSGVALHLYVGRALLARWRESAGDVSRVQLEVVDDHLTLNASKQGQYALDATPGRMPRIHCDSARTLVTLADGRYKAQVKGNTVIVTDPLNEDKSAA